MVTNGVSPKVKIPAIVLGLIGLLLIVASAIVPELEGLRDEGLTLVLASPLAGFLGYRAAPGDVVDIGPASDDLLPARPSDLP